MTNHIVYERDLLDFDVCDGSRAGFFKDSTQLKPPLCLPLLADSASSTVGEQRAFMMTVENWTLRY